jgi:hypothetical protein
MFEIYVRAGHRKERRINLTSRDQVPELRYAGKRFIFSQPRYVAGLQFEVVYLIHVDRAELYGWDDSIGHRRRFISQIYLGASRAAQHLVLATSEERGGMSDILSAPLRTGHLHQV